MLRCFPITAAVAAAALLTLWPLLALAQVDGEQHTPGGTCGASAHPPTPATADAPDWDTFFDCNGSTWQRGPYFFGSSADTCDSNHAGMVQWTGSVFQGCNGTSWGTLFTSSTNPLSALTASTTANTFDNAAYAQSWTWNSLTTGTALSLTSTAITSGTLFSLSDGGGGAGTGALLNVSTYGTGYAGRFYAGGNGGVAVFGDNAGTSGIGVTGDATGNSGTGVYGVASQSNGIGVYGGNGGSGGIAIEGEADTGAGIGVKGLTTSTDNNAKAVYGSNTGGGGTGYAGYFKTTTTGAGYGVYGAITGAGNTGYGGYFTNTSTGGWVLYAAGGASSYFAGMVGIGTAAPAGQLDVESSGTYGGYFNDTGASGYGIYATNGNSGYGGYFSGTGTGSYGIYAIDNGVSGQAIYAYADNNSGVAVHAFTNQSNGNAVWGVNSASGGTAVVGEADSGSGYGIYGQSSSTAAPYAVYGIASGAANTGYAGYFTNTATSGANYGIYASDASASGYGGYFTNTSTGYALYANGNAYVSGGATVGNDTAACSGTNAGTIKYTSNNLYFCNGAAWTQIEAVQSTPVETAPAGSGYFVLTSGTYTGSLGGRSGADSKCLTELTTNTGWQGYSTANSNGQLVAAKVHALICDDTACNNLMPLTSYYFANAGNSSAGGASFTTNSSGNGPGDSNNWSSANYFSGTYNYWTNMGLGTSTVWTGTPQTSSSGNCTTPGWTATTNNGDIGNSAQTGILRWNTNLVTACSSTEHLICYVNP